MILIFGAGRQGECLAYALTKLHHDVFVVDQSISDRVKRIVGDNCWANSLDFSDEKDIWEVLDDFENSDLDLVISCLPYFLNFKIAAACVDSKIPYFDLGGHVETSEAINKYSVENDGEVFTDLGLAPGWVNIMAEECYRKLNQIDKVITINMYCGGLPVNSRRYPLGYARTWSTEGLLNEYKDDCKVILGGEKRTVPGMSGEESYIDPSFECFRTSGGIGKTLDLMHMRGVEWCEYQTIRRKGHIREVKNLIRHGYDVEDFDKLFPVTNQDYVMVKAEARGDNGSYTIEMFVYHDHEFTAMQRATAFPAAVVASQFMERSLYINSRDYSHVNYPAFKTELSKLLGTKL